MIRTRRLYMIWVTNSIVKFNWMLDVLREVEKRDTDRLFACHVFVTSPQHYDLRTMLLVSACACARAQ